MLQTEAAGQLALRFKAAEAAGQRWPKRTTTTQDDPDNMAGKYTQAIKKIVIVHTEAKIQNRRDSLWCGRRNKNKQGCLQDILRTPFRTRVISPRQCSHTVLQSQPCTPPPPPSSFFPPSPSYQIDEQARAPKTGARIFTQRGSIIIPWWPRATVAKPPPCRPRLQLPSLSRAYHSQPAAIPWPLLGCLCAPDRRKGKASGEVGIH